MKANGSIIGRLIVGCALACCLSQNLYAQLAPPGGGGGTNYSGTNSYYSPPDISNYLKYQAQSFLVLDTNAVAISDTNLFNALSSFADDSGTDPVLQVTPYGENCLLFKASHFDYSGESSRDFCLAVCDKLETPLYKSIDLSNPSNNIQNGGWLVQGNVFHWKVSDPMFLMVSNTSRIYNGFFRVIPYGGPEVSLSGPQPNDVVSNTIVLNASVMDLSGVTNEQFEVTVDGTPARYGFGTNNTINVDTKYNQAGPCNVYLRAMNQASVYNPTNVLGDNLNTFFSGLTSLPLDFENDTYLAFASDFCPPEIGTNNIYFVIDKAQQIDATISDPNTGQRLAHYAGYVPYAATIVIPWNFTLSNGVTPYTNDTYKVEFIAYDPTTIDITNTIDRTGVRTGAGCYMTYEAEDAFSPSTGYTGNFLNQQADTWITQTLTELYTDLYQSLSLTQYTTDQVGTGRNHANCQPLDEGHLDWRDFMIPALADSSYSDLTIAQAHGSGATIGGGSYLLSKFTSQELQLWLLGYQPHSNWRLRKAAVWTCYSGALDATADYSSFPAACGMRSGPLQSTTFMRKNCGLFFGGGLPQDQFGGGQHIATAKVAEFLDQIWVCGENAYPGGCDPTYSFAWAVNRTRDEYNPELDLADPRLFGLPQMIYSSAYDDALQTLDFSSVKHAGGN
ncbi:MAG TPA: hypothetical protein VG347_15440 [Verrucomicrobiae bacterium]|nr:hypothetical protein [Verrucomicrobiae bacterium]